MAGKSTDEVFEGSRHVLHGLEQQLSFWQAHKDHAAQKEMVNALTHAGATLREALKRATA